MFEFIISFSLFVYISIAMYIITQFYFFKNFPNYAVSLFVLVNILYVIPLPVRLIFTREISGNISINLMEFINYIPAAILYSGAFLIIFFKIYKKYALSNLKKLNYDINHFKISNREFLLLIIFFYLLSIFFIYLLSIEVGGIMPLILMGYRVTEYFVGKSHYVNAFDWILSLTILMYGFAVINRNKGLMFLTIILFILEVLCLMLMGRRGVVAVFIVAMFATHYFGYSKIKLKYLILAGLIGFLALNFIGLIRGDSYENFIGAIETIQSKNDALQDDEDNNLFYTLTSGNFVVPFETLPQMVKAVGDTLYPRLGLTLINSLLLMVPQFIWNERPPALSNWYMEEFYGSGVEKNEGRQFFFLSEAYLNFGPFGFIFWGWAYAFFFYKISIYCKTNIKNPIILSFYALFLGNILNLVSSDLISWGISFAKGQGLPIAIFFILNRFKNSRKKFQK